MLPGCGWSPWLITPCDHLLSARWLHMVWSQILSNFHSYMISKQKGWTSWNRIFLHPCKLWWLITDLLMMNTLFKKVKVVLTFDLSEWCICNCVCLCVRKWKIAACAPCSLMAHPVTPCRLHVTAAQWLLFLALSPAQRPAAATLPPPLLTRLLSPRKTASLVNDD